MFHAFSYNRYEKGMTGGQAKGDRWRMYLTRRKLDEPKLNKLLLLLHPCVYIILRKGTGQEETLTITALHFPNIG